jgi:hypothetical protein
MLFFAGAFGFFQYPVARATADGPDFFRVQGIAAGSALTILAEPRAGAPAIGSAPSDAVCLRSRSCRGGLTFEEFNTLDDEAKRQRAAANPRWCQVEYQGRTGWVDARHLTEAPCPMADARPQSGASTVVFANGATRSVIKGRLSGRKSIDYLVRAAAGQALEVSLDASNRMTYFNILPPGSTGEAMFAEGGGERQFDGKLPADGVYTIRVYLIRAAARRNERSSFTLSAALSGKALPPVLAKVDALIPGTPYHAQATIKCEPAYTQTRSCEAFVIRRDFEGTATVEIRWDQGRKRHILFVKGTPTVADVPMPMRFTKDAQGNVTIDFDGQDRFEIPEALVVGG